MIVEGVASLGAWVGTVLADPIADLGDAAYDSLVQMRLLRPEGGP